MKTRDLASIGLKVFGICWLMEAFGHIKSFAIIPFVSKQLGFSWQLGVVKTLLFMALYGVPGYLCFFRTSFILRLIALDSAEESSDDAEARQSYGAVAFLLLGLFLAIPAFGHMLNEIIKWLKDWYVISEYSGLSRRPGLIPYLPFFAGHAATVLIGFALIRWRKRLASL